MLTLKSLLSVVVILMANYVYADTTPSRLFIKLTPIFAMNPANPYTLDSYASVLDDHFYLQAGAYYYLVQLIRKPDVAFGIGGKVTVDLVDVDRGFTLPVEGFNGQFGGIIHAKLSAQWSAALHYIHVSSHFSDAPSNKAFISDTGTNTFWDSSYSREFGELLAAYRFNPGKYFQAVIYSGLGMILNSTPQEYEGKSYYNIGLIVKTKRWDKLLQAFFEHLSIRDVTFSPYLISHVNWTQEYERDRLETNNELGLSIENPKIDTMRVGFYYSLSHNPIGKFAISKMDKREGRIGIKISFNRYQLFNSIQSSVR